MARWYIGRMYRVKPEGAKVEEEYEEEEEETEDEE